GPRGYGILRCSHPARAVLHRGTRALEVAGGRLERGVRGGGAPRVGAGRISGGPTRGEAHGARRARPDVGGEPLFRVRERGVGARGAPARRRVRERALVGIGADLAHGANSGGAEGADARDAGERGGRGGAFGPRARRRRRDDRCSARFRPRLRRGPRGRPLGLGYARARPFAVGEKTFRRGFRGGLRAPARDRALARRVLAPALRSAYRPGTAHPLRLRLGRSRHRGRLSRRRPLRGSGPFPPRAVGRPRGLPAARPHGPSRLAGRPGLAPPGVGRSPRRPTRRARRRRLQRPAHPRHRPPLPQRRERRYRRSPGLRRRQLRLGLRLRPRSLSGRNASRPRRRRPLLPLPGRRVPPRPAPAETREPGYL
ncbi:MAG: hypothetical protein AVDCRST_MAG78-3678, partial [uncultured Rubrobacteraceae bacterium]